MLRHASEVVSDEAGSAAADASGRLYQMKADKHRSHRAVNLMLRRRGRFLRSLEELIIVRRVRSQPRPTESEYLYPVGSSPISAIVLPVSGDAELGILIVQDFQFLCNITPVRLGIQINDQVVRNSGETSEKIFIVKQVQLIDDLQQLSLAEQKGLE